MIDPGGQPVRQGKSGGRRSFSFPLDYSATRVTGKHRPVFRARRSAGVRAWVPGCPAGDGARKEGGEGIPRVGPRETKRNETQNRPQTHYSRPKGNPQPPSAETSHTVPARGSDSPPTARAQ